MPPLPQSKTPRAERWIDASALMAIRNLELRARAVVDGFWRGIHRSPYHGFSSEFTEYRPYSPGDDTRHLDWKLFARSDRYFLKRFEDETNLRCHLLVDQSRSMAYGSLSYTKADYARTLAATLAWFLSGQGDAVGLLTFSGRALEYLPARHRRGHLRRILLALEKKSDGAETSLEQPLRRATELARKRGLIVLISDMLAPVEALESHLARVAAAGHEAIVFQVLDPAEISFAFDKPAFFQDSETGREIYADPEAARPEYQRRLEAHAEAVKDACGKLGFSFYRMATDQPMESALLDFLLSREARGKAVRRQSQSTAPA
jgi:uncharacterized protein (DUF58 family)